jgi:hypothetical protein
LCYFYGRGFAFYDHDFFSQGVENDDIGPFLQAVKLEASLDLDQRPGEISFRNQILNKMLPHPLLWSQDQMLFAKLVEYIVPGRSECNPKRVLRQIKFSWCK